ncbi:uncharacterized protein LOC118736993 isoform X2 [Rhagoletis pomonella]|uniref:uncharacterized protein LOC118735441 isoform X2 n=1 Tax=Rhagoletis pomonella TaxID=28610 RepID=UPI001783045A|nr:uncharacterized protein LOC118735441 isoform X2 [Rhagoletis pomonella]XP_036323100.1 uncharacterized protein LOC118736993 isoform X2 [Rhagoletis pomonella]
MDELEEILIKLNGEMFLSLFREGGFTRESMMLLKPSHLDTLIDAAQFGPRIIFEHNLLNWQTEQGVHVQTAQSDEGASFANASIAEVELIYKHKHKTLEEILRGSVSGSQVLKYYSKTKVLTPKYRKLLAATIANYLISSGVNSSPKTFESFASQISNFFLSESKDIYYIHKKGKKPGGCLYTKYHSTLFKCRQDGIINKKPAEEKPQKAAHSNLCTTDYTQEKSWLKYNVEPFDEVQIKWELTFEVRCQMLQDDSNLNKILEEWPLYKQSFGHLLIETDFNKLYPEKKNLLFEKWENFSQAVRHIFEIYIKDSHSLTTWKQFKEGTIKAGTDAVTCYLLHSVLVPTSREYKTCKQTKKQHLVKATIEDSRNSFLIWATTNCELQSKLKLMVDENYKGKSTIQPIICAIGMSLFESNEYFVYFANIFYKFDNVIKCIDVCFKIFHVLNLKYPSECKSIWFFVQQYFYDIALESHEKSTSLCAILSDLKQFKCFNNN